MDKLSDEELLNGLRNTFSTTRFELYHAELLSRLSDRRKAIEEVKQWVELAKQLVPVLEQGRRAIEILKEIHEYLQPNPMNYVGCNSILHGKIKDILFNEQAKEPK